MLVEQQRPGAYLERVVGEKERTLYYYVCVPSQFSVKRHPRLVNYREFDLEGDLVGGTQYVLFIGPIFHNTIETHLKRVGYGCYE